MSKDINLKIKADSSNAETGLKKIETSINKFGNNKTIRSIGTLGRSLLAVKSSFKLITGALKAANAAIKETTEAYKKQAKAEKQLEVAAANNPYLSKTAVEDLKNYASELQKISTVGDEELLPMMAQLATAGRTQQEIQSIMSAALDVSASGMMSLDSAVSALNKTYSGSVGLLANQISGLKGLTTEELKNGKAVEVVAERFKGISAETAKATGTSEQLKNAWGDLKEELGEPIEKGIFAPFRRSLTNAVNDTIEHIKNLKKSVKEVQDEADRMERKKKGKETANDIVGSYEFESQHLEKLISYYKEVAKDVEHYNATERGEATKKIQTYTLELAKLNEKNKAAQRALEIAEKEAELKKQQKAADDAQAEADAKAQKAIDKYNKTVADAENNIAVRRKLGEVITENAEAQEMLSVRTSAYIQMLKDAEGTISGEKGFAKEEAERIAAAAKALAETSDDLEKANIKEFNKIIDAWTNQRDQTLEVQKQMLQDYADYLDKKGDLTKEEIELRERLKQAQENIDAAIIQKQKDDLAEMFENLNSYISEFASITQSMTDLIRKSNESETEQELADLSKQYTDGLISYEEYCRKKEEIDKEAANKEYKLKMWEWTASLLTATANIAEGISKAIAQGGLAGIISGALVSAAGAIQIATLTANKPRPPQFTSGGIVPGTSYSGDNVTANVNSGEMILNASQQKQLWKMANGNGGSNPVINMPVKIENNASNDVSASATMTARGLTVTIDKIVNSSMKNGKYNASMNYANSTINGVSVL